MKKKQLTIVIKLGTSSIVDEKTHRPLIANLGLIAETCTKLRDEGHRVLLVSSGAIGIALWQMNRDRRPKHLDQVQALAAIGQCHLMRTWDEVFGHLKQPVAQVLLTRNDIADHTQYNNAKNTLKALFEMGVIPIVNENDTLSVAEIKFGDNDTLSAIAAGMIRADYLFLMTDVDCLYDKNPRIHPDARPIEVIHDIAALEADVSSAGSSVGTGGMSTKIIAARRATAAGVTTVITRSSEPGNVARIVKYVESFKYNGQINGIATSGVSLDHDFSDATTLASSTTSLHDEAGPAPLHTRFIPNQHPIRNRSFRILHSNLPRGTIYIDEGAQSALINRNGLFPVGVVEVEGTFAQQETVRICVVKRALGQSITDSPRSPTAPMPDVAPATPTRLHTRTASYGLGGYEGSGGDSLASLIPSSESTPPRVPYDKTVAPVEVARAIVNYSSAEIRRIRGLKSTDIASVLGYADSDYVAVRDNIAMTKAGGESRPATPAPVASTGVGGLADSLGSVQL